MPESETDETGSADAFPLATAEAFRTALKARFTAIARADPGYRLDELHRQFAYDRVLARCFTGEDRGPLGAPVERSLLSREATPTLVSGQPLPDGSTRWWMGPIPLKAAR